MRVLKRAGILLVVVVCLIVWRRERRRQRVYRKYQKIINRALIRQGQRQDKWMADLEVRIEVLESEMLRAMGEE